MGASPQPHLWVEGSSSWTVLPNPDCGALKRETSNIVMLKVGGGEPVQVKLDGNVFRSWIGTREEICTGPNYLGILTLGWCYVLSAMLVELRGDGAFVRYTNSRAHGNASTEMNPSNTVSLDIGEVDEDVARWWSAILAPGEGWEAFIKHESNDFAAPWTIVRTCDTSFSIKHATLLLETCMPLSSREAFDALIKFACLYKLGSQFPIALATALTLPIHRFYDWTAHLPLPGQGEGKKSAVSEEILSASWINLFEDIPYYMTLSCSPELLMSTLCGSFWEPGVPCNLVSPWLHPVLNEVLGDPSSKPGYDEELLALICGIRRPNISAIWIGAVTSGLGPKILRMAGSGHPPLDKCGFAWTGCPQSFMDVPGSGSYICSDRQNMQRQDTWRLLHLPVMNNDDDLLFNVRPFAPWAPCGICPIKNVALRVTAHLDCDRHDFQYDHWEIELEDGTTVKDYGYKKISSTPRPKSLCVERDIDVPTLVFGEKEFDVEQEASREASWQIFHYLFVNEEGVSPEKIYHDDWVREVWDHDESDLEVACDEAGSKGGREHKNDTEDRVRSWIDEDFSCG